MSLLILYISSLLIVVTKPKNYIHSIAVMNFSDQVLVDILFGYYEGSQMELNPIGRSTMLKDLHFERHCCPSSTLDIA